MTRPDGIVHSLKILENKLKIKIAFDELRFLGQIFSFVMWRSLVIASYIV